MFADHCGMLQEVSDHWDDLVMYLSDIWTRNKQGTVMTQTVESEIEEGWKLLGRFAIVAKSPASKSTCSKDVTGTLH